MTHMAPPLTWDVFLGLIFRSKSRGGSKRTFREGRMVSRRNTLISSWFRISQFDCGATQVLASVRHRSTGSWVWYIIAQSLELGSPHGLIPICKIYKFGLHHRWQLLWSRNFQVPCPHTSVRSEFDPPFDLHVFLFACPLFALILFLFLSTPSHLMTSLVWCVYRIEALIQEQT